MRRGGGSPAAWSNVVVKEAGSEVVGRSRSIWLVLGVVLAVGPAHGGAAAGTCVGNMSFSFANQISNNSGQTSYTMSGSGNCQTSAQAAASKTMSFSGAGTATSSRCAALMMQGAYTVVFFPDPAPAGGSGQMNFNGTASGGSAVWTGSSPTLVGIQILAGGGLVACTGGTNALSFTMSFTFIDP